MSALPKVKLWLTIDNITMLALDIPLAKCSSFSINPLKWLRFLGFAIYGREGYLSTIKGGPEIDEYTANIEARSYYFVSEAKACLVDVDALDDRTSDGTTSDVSHLTNLTTRRRGFRANLIERDGTCVITGDIDENCDACHILPHGKGSNYISNVVHHRGGTDDFESTNDINNINDIRNGLLLITPLHRVLGAGKLAFLKTPNFALTVDDIPYRPLKEADKESPASRLTLHYFVDTPLLGVVIPRFAPHNSDARQPQDISEWPPAIITDFFYAMAAINAWSPKSFIEYVQKMSRDTYYNDDDGQDDDGNVTDGRGPSHVEAQMDDQTTGLSGCKTSNISTDQPKESCFTDLMDGVSALWMQSSKVGKTKQEGVRTSGPARNEGVEMWLQSIEDSTA